MGVRQKVGDTLIGGGREWGSGGGEGDGACSTRLQTAHTRNYMSSR